MLHINLIKISMGISNVLQKPGGVIVFYIFIGYTIEYFNTVKMFFSFFK